MSNDLDVNKVHELYKERKAYKSLYKDLCKKLDDHLSLNYEYSFYDLSGDLRAKTEAHQAVMDIQKQKLQEVKGMDIATYLRPFITNDDIYNRISNSTNGEEAIINLNKAIVEYWEKGVKYIHNDVVVAKLFRELSEASHKEMAAKINMNTMSGNLSK